MDRIQKAMENRKTYGISNLMPVARGRSYTEQMDMYFKDRLSQHGRKAKGDTSTLSVKASDEIQEARA